MKSILTLALVAGLVSTANAAVESSSSASTTEGAGQVDPNIETSTAKVGDVHAVETPRKWTASFESETYKAVTNKADSSGKPLYNGDFEAYQTVKLGYKLTDDLSVQVVQDMYQVFGYDGGGQNNESDTTFIDPNIRLTKSHLFKTGAMDWTLQGRAYLPISADSREANQLAQLRAYFIGGMELTKKLGLELTVSPRYYIYETESRATGKNDWRILNTAGVKYSLTDALAVETTLGVYSMKDVGDQDMSHFQDYSTSVYVDVNKHVSLNGGVRAGYKAQNIDTDGVDLYNLSVSEYFGILTLSL